MEFYDFDGFTNLAYISRGDTSIKHKGMDVVVKEMCRVAPERV